MSGTALVMGPPGLHGEVRNGMWPRSRSTFGVAVARGHHSVSNRSGRNRGALHRDFNAVVAAPELEDDEGEQALSVRVAPALK